MKQIIEVKAWIIDKAQEIASEYNCYIDYAERDELGIRIENNGYIKVIVEEILAESEKAIHVRLQTGEVLGSTKGWKVWIPKSQMA